MDTLIYLLGRGFIAFVQMLSLPRAAWLGRVLVARWPSASTPATAVWRWTI